MSGKPSSTRGGAMIVGAGIFLSRVIGFLRERAIAHYLGSSDAADALRAAMRIPNFLQNLFGEGALSASFIPVYAGLKEKDPEAAARVAGVILSMLALLTSLLVLLGYVFTPQLIQFITPGFVGEKREAAIHMVRILFPGIGMLVMSAFCLGVLNSHRRFFIPYAAPVLWNGAIIATAFLWHSPDAYILAEHICWGAVIGSFLQLAVQIPPMFPYMRGMRPGFQRSEPVRLILTRFVPTLMSRGVVQISAFFDSMITSLLSTGAISNLSYAQLLYTLPTSLFGGSIAAAGLVDMATADQKQEMSKSLTQGMRNMAFFVVPSAVAFLLLGHVLASVIFQTGKFGDREAKQVWIILGGYAVGLLASTQSRLLTTAFYALKNTRTPFQFSVVRVVSSIGLAALFSLLLPRYLPIPPDWATAGIAVASSIAGLLEFTLLRRALQKDLKWTRIEPVYLLNIGMAALFGGALGAVVFHNLQPFHLPHWLSGGVALGVYGSIYLGLTLAFGVEESRAFYRKIRRRLF